MPTGIGIAAVTGALLGSASALAIAGVTLTALQGALLFAGLAAAQYLLRPKLSAPSLQSTRTLNTIRTELEPARWVFGRAKIGGVMVFAEENKEEIRVGPRPDGQTRKDRDVDAWRGQYFTYVVLLAEEALEGIERLWINGVEQPIRYGRQMTAPAGTGGLDSGDGRLITIGDFGEQPTPIEGIPDSPGSHAIVPPETGDWGIGDGTGRGDWPGEKDDRRRLNRGTRNVEPGRYPYIIWQRLSGEGKPPYAFSRAGRGWWRKEQLTEEKGKPGHAYLVIDLYQNSRIDEDTGNQAGYNWNGVPDIQVQVRGMRLPLPLADGSDGTPVADSNPCRAGWFFLRRRVGMPHQGLDAEGIIEAADECAERVPDNAYDDDPRGFDPTRTRPRFSANGVVVSGDPVSEVLREISQAMGGAIILSNGQVSFRTGKRRTAVRTIPVEEMIALRGVEIQPPMASRANQGTVRVSQSELHDWQPFEVGARAAYPIINRAARDHDGVALAIDTGERAYITSPSQARALVKSELTKLRGPEVFDNGRSRGRRGSRMTAVYTFNVAPGDADENLGIQAFDRIKLSWPPLELDEIDVEVLSKKINADWTVDLVVRHNDEPGGEGEDPLCPGLGDAPPELPASDDDGHVFTFYAAPSTLLPEIED